MPPSFNYTGPAAAVTVSMTPPIGGGGLSMNAVSVTSVRARVAENPINLTNTGAAVSILSLAVQTPPFDGMARMAPVLLTFPAIYKSWREGGAVQAKSYMRVFPPVNG